MLLAHLPCSPRHNLLPLRVTLHTIRHLSTLRPSITPTKDGRWPPLQLPLTTQSTMHTTSSNSKTRIQTPKPRLTTTLLHDHTPARQTGPHRTTLPPRRRPFPATAHISTKAPSVRRGNAQPDKQLPTRRNGRLPLAPIPSANTCLHQSPHSRPKMYMCLSSMIASPKRTARSTMTTDTTSSKRTPSSLSAVRLDLAIRDRQTPLLTPLSRFSHTITWSGHLRQGCPSMGPQTPNRGRRQDHPFSPKVQGRFTH